MTITQILPVTEPAPAAPLPRAGRVPAGPGCIVAVSPSGRLQLPTATHLGAVAMHRRTSTGTVYRLRLDDDLSCWLDGDQQDGSGALNPIATAMCTAMSGCAFTGPDDAPLVCGLVLFTGTRRVHRAGISPVGLTDAQLRRVVDGHAVAGDDLDAATWFNPVDDVAQHRLLRA